MNIGAAAKASGISAKMIRYYEQTALIPAVERSDSGYRSYSAADVQRLQFIRRARELGFSVPRINELLGLWDNPGRQSADVKRLARQHIAELGLQVGKLQEMMRSLQNLVDCCAGDDRPDCPILADLQQTGGNATGKCCS